MAFEDWWRSVNEKTQSISVTAAEFVLVHEAYAAGEDEGRKLNVGLSGVDAVTKPSDHKPVVVIVDGERYKYWARAMWIPKHTLEDTGDNEGFGELNEADDTYYWPEGWYEWNHAEETHWRISEPVILWAEVVMPQDAESGEGGLDKATTWQNEAAAVMARFINLSNHPDSKEWSETAGDAIRLLNVKRK